MKNSNFKHAYAFTLLLMTFLWALFCVWMTGLAIKNLNSLNVIAAAGCDTLLGALVTWNALVIQFFFRKAGPGEKVP